jgi:UDPglucose 6-dehydrogenase
MKVCVIGTGYVGLVTGTGLAEMGNDVVCVDNNAEKIKQLEAGISPIYEPGLEELLDANMREGRLTFSTDLTRSVQEADICMIAVGTPQGDDGAADLSAVFGVAESIAKAANGFKVIVTKSTVPVGTADKIQAIVKQHTQQALAVVSNPEFLKQGAAVEDFLKPDRVIIGAEDPRAAEMMRELYSPFLRTGNPVIMMDIRSAEMTKYVANSFLATKISFINEMANLCEHLGADITMVRSGISSDKRIGGQFLFPGVGYGGSCFPKDVKALIQTALSEDYIPEILQAVHAVNQNQRKRFLEKIVNHYHGNLTGKTFAVWGLAFKARTDDMREAPALTIIEGLLAAGAKVKAFDPKAMPNAKAVLGDKIEYGQNAYDVLPEADALLVLTEWNEFRRPNFERVKESLKYPVLFDGRNQYEAEQMAKKGFQYFPVGRLPIPIPAPVNV